MSQMSTFATLRALQLVIADALDDIQRVFLQGSTPDCPSPGYPSSPDPSPVTSPFPTSPPTSFPPTPLSATFPSTSRSPQQTDAGVTFVDYPSPNLPLVSNSLSEQLALHPDAAAAASKIVAACGQLSNIVHKPFLSLCDAIMNYNLPACMRLVEHLHVAEILREAENGQHDLVNAQGAGSGATLDSRIGDTGCDATEVGIRMPATGMEWTPGSRVHKITEGLHVVDITNVICSYAGDSYVDPNDLVHALRLLSTHHIFRETAPDTFALTRVASLLDSGKSVRAVFLNPETKYDDTGGIPAFVALNTDELFKSAAYLTEAFTGVQLPTLVSTPNPSRAADAILPGTTTFPCASNIVMNDSIPCAPTARSSSILTHIAYPEDEDVQPPRASVPSIEPLQKDVLHALPKDVPTSCQLLGTGTSALPPNQSLIKVSTEVEMERLHSGDTAKLEKLPAFNLAFRTHAPFFEWLENNGEDPLGRTGQGACIHTPRKMGSLWGHDVQPAAHNHVPNSGKSFRLERFSKAMMGTTLWEAPKAILGGFDWHSLPRGSTIVDVGGGIGSTTMILARALSDPRADSVKKLDGAHNEGLQLPSAAVPHHRSKTPSDPLSMVDDESRNLDMSLRFIVQDRPVVTALGIEAWRSKCPEMLQSGQVVFQDHDFFEPQSPLEPPHITRQPAVYLLRVVLHDWPDECARRILINLRVASNPETRLIIAEHVLPLACVDEDVLGHADIGVRTEEWTLNAVLANIEGAERTLVSPPLLSNLGKASANAYWMDLLMHITFNGKERTLREFCSLGLSTGWRVTRMTRPEGTLFAYLVCEPITLPDDAQAIHNAVVLSSELSNVVTVPSVEPMHHSCADPSSHKRLLPRPVSLLPSPILERSSSRCGTPTFGSRIQLPRDEELQSPRTRGSGSAKKWLRSKGLGVRSVMMQKVEKQREEQTSAKDGPARDDSDVQNMARASPSHMRVWWKKSPAQSTSNSVIALHEPSGEASEHRITGREQRGTFRRNDSPSTSSPNTSPAHQKWPSTESAGMSMSEASLSRSRVRRPSVASITRKLSFAAFGRRPSIADITEPLPMPPYNATFTKLAPPPNLRGDSGRSLKHLPSLPTLGCSEVIGSTAMGRPAIPRRPSFSLIGQTPPSQPVAMSALLRCPDTAEPPKSGILKSPTILPTSSPVQGRPESTLVPQRQRRVTLSNSPGGLSRIQVPSPGSVSVPRNPTGPEEKHIQSTHKLPRRLSIPMLRRKQSRSVVQEKGVRV